MSTPIVLAGDQLLVVQLALYSQAAQIELERDHADAGGCHDCRSARGRHGPTARCRHHREDLALLAATRATYSRVHGGATGDPWQDPRVAAVLDPTRRRQPATPTVRAAAASGVVTAPVLATAATP